MEATRVIQMAGVIFCLILAISEVCYCYPSSYYSSLDEENAEQGVRGMIQDWEGQGLIRYLMPIRPYLSNFGSKSNGHEIMTRKSPRSNSNNNLRLRYGKRSNMPQYEQAGGTSSGTDDAGVNNIINGGLVGCQRMRLK